MDRVGWLVVAVVAMVLGLACSERCVPGETQMCNCSDGRAGAQLCRSDGVFDPCVCTGPLPGMGGGVTGGGFGGGTGGGFAGGLGGGSGGGFGGGFGGGGQPARAPHLVKPSAAHVVVGDPLVLSVVHDAGQLPLVWSWAVRAPDGGAGSLDDSTRAQPLFSPEAAGDYLVEVTATSDAGSTSTTFPVRASIGRILDWEPTSLAMNPTGDCLALGRGASFTVELHDLVTGGFESVSLTRTPLALAFTPDGTRLIVGQDAQVQVISMETEPPEVIATWAVGGIVARLVATDAVVYIQAADDDLFWVRLATGEQGSRFFSSTLGALGLHPDGSRIYAVENDFSGTWIYRLGIDPADGGITTNQSKSFSSSSNPPCKDGWLSRTGDVLFTACGNLFRTAPVFANDLVYGGQMPMLRYVDVRESVDGGLVFGLAQPQVSTSPMRLGPSLVATIDRATLRQNSIAPQPDTSGALGSELKARSLFVDSQNRVHIFLGPGTGVSTVKSFWLIRTVGEL